jgi:hypothetical protein
MQQIYQTLCPRADIRVTTKNGEYSYFVPDKFLDAAILRGDDRSASTGSSLFLTNKLTLEIDFGVSRVFAVDRIRAEPVAFYAITMTYFIL